MPRNTWTIVLSTCLAVSLGCGGQETKKPPTYNYNYNYGTVDPASIAFADDLKPNTEVTADALKLTFTDAKGETVDLTQYRGKKHLVLVITRGYAGALCPYCSTQTARLLSNYGEFTKRNAEVLVVFPGPTEQLDAFVQRVQSEASGTKLAFPLLLDKDSKAIDKLGIKGDLAKPSTYILDKEGQVKFAYVGATSVDRPSVKAMLQQLDNLEKKAG